MDLGFVRTPIKSLPIGVSVSVLYREPIILALPEWHLLATRKKIPLKALSDEPFVGLRIHDGVGFNAQVAEICAIGGLSPKVLQRADQLVALAGMVAGGLGLAFVPDPLRGLIRAAYLICGTNYWPFGPRSLYAFR